MATKSASDNAPFPELALAPLPDVAPTLKTAAPPPVAPLPAIAPMAAAASTPGPTVATNQTSTAPAAAPNPAEKPASGGLVESTVPLFDIAVSFAPGIAADVVRARAMDDLGLTEEKVDAILRALLNGPKAVIGKSVPQDRAEKARADFTRIGMRVELVPVLSLQTMTKAAEDGSQLCPACDKRIMLPASRQCPECGVFVDKVTDEFLLRKKLIDKERAIAEMRLGKEAADNAKRNKEQFERELQAKIRREIEEEYGLNDGKQAGLFSGNAGKIRALAGVGVLVVAVAAGRFTSGVGAGGDKAAEGKGAPGAIGQTIKQAQDAAAGPNPEQAMAQALEKSLPDEVVASIDPSDEESLLKAARNGGGKGMSVEQAVAAAGTLAKAVGNNTLERANNGTLPSGTAGAASSTPGGGAGGGTAGANAASNTAAVTLPKEVKLGLTAELVATLGELGQNQRSHEIAKSMAVQPDVMGDPVLAVQVRAADIFARAWALNGQSPGKASQQASELKDLISKISDGQERAVAYSRAAAVLSQHANLPREVQVALLSLGGETVKTLPTAQQGRAREEWIIAMGDSLLADLIEAARAGKWPRAQEAYKRLNEVIANAPSAEAAASLHGLEYRARMVMGLTDKMDGSIGSGLLWASKAGEAVDQARAIRGLVQRSGAVRNPQLATAAMQLAEKTLSAPASARKSAALSELSQTLLLLGQEVQAAKLRDQAREAAAGLAGAEGPSLVARLLVRNDLALAKLRHSEGAYSETEGLLQRVAGYLL